jgi:hypothetical protein
MVLQTSHVFKCMPILQPVENTSVGGVSSLIAAAVVDSSFRELLLANPAYALERGYYGQCFQLSDEERQLVESIRANSLSDFASQLVGCLPN